MLLLVPRPPQREAAAAEANLLVAPALRGRGQHPQAEEEQDRCRHDDYLPVGPADDERLVNVNLLVEVQVVDEERDEFRCYYLT